MLLRADRRVVFGVPGLLALGLAAGLIWRAVGGSYEQQLYVRTLALALQAAAGALPIALLLAWILLRTQVPLARGLIVLLLGQLLMPLYLHAAAWEAGFGRLGWYSIRVSGPDRPLLSGWHGALWTHIVGGLPWAIVILGAGLWVVPRDAEQAARLDAGPLAALRAIVLPHLAAWIAVAGIWIAVNVTTEMTAADLYLVDTYAREIYTGFALGRTGEEVFVRAAPAILLTALLAAFGLALAGHSVRARPLAGERPPPRWPLGAWRPWVLLLAALWVVLLCGVPLGNLLYQAGYEEGRFQLGTAVQALVSGVEEFRAELFWSGVIAAVTTSVALPLSVLLAAVMHRGQSAAWIAMGILAFLLALPGPLVGLTVINALNRLDAPWLVMLADRSVLAPVLAATVRALPWSTLVVWLARRAVPREHIEFARLEGAGPLHRYTHVVLPQLVPALALGALLVFALAGGELAATILVAPPGMPTVPVRLFGLIHAGVRDKEASLAVLNIAFCTLLAFAATRISVGAHYSARTTGQT